MRDVLYLKDIIMVNLTSFDVKNYYYYTLFPSTHFIKCLSWHSCRFW